jgi:hypothetical protein
MVENNTFQFVQMTEITAWFWWQMVFIGLVESFYTQKWGKQKKKLIFKKATSK